MIFGLSCLLHGVKWRKTVSLQGGQLNHEYLFVYWVLSCLVHLLLLRGGSLEETYFFPSGPDLSNFSDPLWNLIGSVALNDRLSTVKNFRHHIIFIFVTVNLWWTSSSHSRFPTYFLSVSWPLLSCSSIYSPLITMYVLIYLSIASLKLCACLKFSTSECMWI